MSDMEGRFRRDQDSMVPKGLMMQKKLYLPLLTWCVAASVCASEQAMRSFLDKHCMDCHDGDSRKGGLDLQALSQKKRPCQAIHGNVPALRRGGHRLRGFLVDRTESLEEGQRDILVRERRDHVRVQILRLRSIADAENVARAQWRRLVRRRVAAATGRNSEGGEKQDQVRVTQHRDKLARFGALPRKTRFPEVRLG